MRFIAPHPLEPDETIRIHSDLCHAVARVAHCERYADERWAIGVEFITLRFASARGTFVSSKV
jgi:hypothetical protein